MGNTYQQTSSKQLQVYIETQKSFYNSGSILQGIVFVHAVKDFQLDALYIRIQGYEECKWFEGTSKNMKKYMGTEQFYVDEHLLCRYHNKLSTGKYAYPFALQLSENIPGSFSDTLKDARIQYKLIAYFTNYSKKNYSYFYSIPLIIREPFRQDLYQYEGEITAKPKLCCFSKGQTYMHVRYFQNVCFQGQSVAISVSIDNSRGKAPVNQILIYLVQYTFVSANNGTSRTYRNILDIQRVQINVGEGQKKQNCEMKYQVKKDLKQTAISTLVANYYRLEVKADMGTMMSNVPIIYSPLFIMKNKFKEKKGKNLKDHKLKIEDYRKAERQYFKSPEFWFKMNKDLQIVNFRTEDVMGYHSESQYLLPVDNLHQE